ncbi:MAG: hypothetical protein Tsb009_30420 [Planctomycetaceae bacterium]
MDKTTRLTPEQRENLVAYLDGELDEETVEILEATLAKSPEARHEVDMLMRTWALMDELPQPNPSQEFTVRTLTAVKTEALTEQNGNRISWYRHARRGIMLGGFAILIGVAAFLGYHATYSLMPDENEPIIQELEVIENLDNYSDVRDIEFLRELAREKVFDEESDDKTP